MGNIPCGKLAKMCGRFAASSGSSTTVSSVKYRHHHNHNQLFATGVGATAVRAGHAAEDTNATSPAATIVDRASHAYAATPSSAGMSTK